MSVVQGARLAAILGLCFGCSAGGGNGSDGQRTTAPTSTVGVAQNAPDDGAAAAAKLPNLPKFDAQRAMQTLTQLVDFGQRYYGAPRRAEAITRLESALKASTPHVSRQTFAATESASGETYQLTNLIARLNPEQSHRVLLGSHFDTRLWAEEDDDATKHARPIVGANDGTSGVAVLLEALRVMAADPLFSSAGIDVVLFDGEEFGRPSTGDYCKGSTYLAAHINDLYPGSQPAAAIVLDMVGDKQLGIKREQSSQRGASRALNDLFWEVGRRRDPSVFIDQTRSAIIDDHTPLQKIGVPAILVIDLEYPYWHTHQDTIDKVSEDSLAVVGATLLEVVYRLTSDGRDGHASPTENTP